VLRTLNVWLNVSVKCLISIVAFNIRRKVYYRLRIQITLPSYLFLHVFVTLRMNIQNFLKFGHYTNHINMEIWREGEVLKSCKDLLGHI
jgi:hypothetical protein